MSIRSSLAAFSTATILASSAGAQISFQPATPYPLQGFRPEGVATGDFDGVNGPDFAVASSSPQGVNGPSRVEIFLNQGAGTFVAGATIVVGQNDDTAEIVSADFDRDGDLDLAVALKGSNSVRVLLNSGGVFSLGPNIPVGAIEPAHLAAGDVDGDGDLDLVTSNRSSNSLSILRNSGAGVFALAGTILVGSKPYAVVLEDLNGDNRTDIAVAAHDSREIDLLFAQGGGTFAAPVALKVPGNEKPSGLVAADLDADGDMDLATTSDQNGIGIVIVLRNTAGAFSGATYLSNGLNPGAIVAGDFDGDGDKDLATADELANRISVLPNLGAGTFGAATIFAVGAHPDALARSDFDRNGSLDLVAANRDTNNASVLRNSSVSGTDTFCVTTPNSAGYGTRIDSTGSLSLGANTFTLLAHGAPANVTGLFFYGTTRTFAAFGNGRRCTGGAIKRIKPPVTTSSSGLASQHLDFTTAPGNTILPGSTKYVQFWHRDVPAGGSLTNASDALRATFRP